MGNLGGNMKNSFKINKQKKANIKKPVRFIRYKNQTSENTYFTRNPINLKTQLITALLLPIIIIIVFGTSSYIKASNALNNNYEKSNMRMLSLITENIDSVLKDIRADCAEMAVNSDINKYLKSYLNDENSLESYKLKDNIANMFITKQTLNSYIKNIALVPVSKENKIITIQSTDIKNDGSVYKELISHKTNMGTFTWFVGHEKTDAAFNWNADDTLFSAMMLIPGGDILLLDISKQAVMELIGKISTDDTCSVSLVTLNNEWIYNGLTRTPIKDTEFYQNAYMHQEPFGTEYVKIDGESYLFMYVMTKSLSGMITSLIPEDTVIAEALHIKNAVIIYVIIALILLVSFSVFMMFGIQSSMHKITDALNETAKGNLAIEINTKGNTEFSILAKRLADMVNNTKKLVLDVKNIIQNIFTSAQHIDEVTKSVNKSSEEISAAMQEIVIGSQEQTKSANICLDNMVKLSTRINNTTTNSQEVLALAEDTKNKLTNLKFTFDELKEQSTEGANISKDITFDVEKLVAQSTSIAEYITKINDVARQTKLLSLNATIESTKAGVHGKGFAVVADEIKILSENSLKVSALIEKAVYEIFNMTRAVDKSTKSGLSINNEQVKKVEKTQTEVIEMVEAIDNLILKIQKVNDEMEYINDDRQNTLNAIESISAVLEESASTSEMINTSILEQAQEVNALHTSSNNLHKDMNNLHEAISKFKIK